MSKIKLSQDQKNKLYTMAKTCFIKGIIDCIEDPTTLLESCYKKFGKFDRKKYFIGFSAYFQNKNITNDFVDKFIIEELQNDK